MTESILAHSYRLPPADWRDGEQHAFLGFTIHMHTSHCSCGAVERHSEVYRIFGHKTLTFGSNYRRLVPLEPGAPFPRDEPVAQFSYPPREVAVCGHCIASKVQDPEGIIQLRLATDEKNWLAALAEDRRREEALRAKKPERSERADIPSATADELMNL